MHSKGTNQVNTLIQTMNSPCRLRNIKVKILAGIDTHVRSGNAYAGEIILGNQFLVASGLNVKNFLADYIDRLSSIDYGNLDSEEETAKVGKLGFLLLSQDIDIDGKDKQLSAICSILTNGNFPQKDGDYAVYKDVEVGVKDEAESQEAIEAMISRGSKLLAKDSEPTIGNIVSEFNDTFRMKLGIDSLVGVQTMNKDSERTTLPMEVLQRTCSSKQLSFLKKKVEELIKVGYIDCNNDSK